LVISKTRAGTPLIGFLAQSDQTSVGTFHWTPSPNLERHVLQKLASYGEDSADFEKEADIGGESEYFEPEEGFYIQAVFR